MTEATRRRSRQRGGRLLTAGNGGDSNVMFVAIGGYASVISTNITFSYGLWAVRVLKRLALVRAYSYSPGFYRLSLIPYSIRRNSWLTSFYAPPANGSTPAHGDADGAVPLLSWCILTTLTVAAWQPVWSFWRRWRKLALSIALS